MATKLDQQRYQAEHGRRPYWLSLLIAVDQLANAVLWGFVDETLSSRAYRCSRLELYPKGRWVAAERLIDILFFWDFHLDEGGHKVRHCQRAFLGELSREHLPAEFRRGR